MTLERWNDDRLDKLAEAVAQTSQNLHSITAAQLELVRTVERIVQSMDSLSDNQLNIAQSLEKLVNVQAQLAEHMACTNAATERLDRLMDYLIGRDGERISRGD
jgi:methyl-accepting chemotaxis protein